jgi:hypothetical protein
MYYKSSSFLVQILKDFDSKMKKYIAMKYQKHMDRFSKDCLSAVTYELDQNHMI